MKFENSSQIIDAISSWWRLLDTDSSDRALAVSAGLLLARISDYLAHQEEASHE